MARMLDALRRLEATNRFVAPAAPAVVEPAVPPELPAEPVAEAIAAPAPIVTPEVADEPAELTATPAEATADAEVTLEAAMPRSTAVAIIDVDEPPFEPTFGPLVSWEGADANFAYASHAIDDALDALDELADGVAESIAPSHLVAAPVAERPLEEQPREESPAPLASELPVEAQPEIAASPLDEFDPSAVIEQHQREYSEDQQHHSTACQSDAPAVAEDVLSTIQYAEHWATIALEEFGVRSAPLATDHTPPTENFALPAAPAEPPTPVAEASPPAAKLAAKPREEVARPEPSIAEMAAMLDLNDEVLCAQYVRLGERIVADLTATTKTCAAILSIEHQPHVTDVALRTAMVLCRAGKQVLVIDAALSDKHLTSGLAMPVEFGLAEVLKGRVPWQQAVRATATPGLCVLPAGRLTPPRLADDDHRLKDVLKELTSQWDLVLLDAGSLADSSARYVAAAARNVYLVVRLGETAVDAAQLAAQSLNSKDIVLRGCVVTNAPN